MISRQKGIKEATAKESLSNRGGPNNGRISRHEETRTMDEMDSRKTAIKYLEWHLRSKETIAVSSQISLRCATKPDELAV